METNKIFSVNQSIRLDKFLSDCLSVSRNQIINLIKSENVLVNDKIISKQGLKLKPNDEVIVNLPKPKEIDIIQKVNFDVDIIYEDDDILVINKPFNLVIHSAPSLKEPTLVDWLKQNGFSLSTINAEIRHGIVHRLDRDTTGAMVIAKNNDAHQFLSEQLQDKSMGRYYLALTDLTLKDNIEINKPIARNPKNRLKMGIVNGGKEAKSKFIKLANSKNSKFELISAKLFTGRTHQIRVHLSSISRHILGDSLYGFKSESVKIKRVFLHSYILYLFHPRTKEKMEFIAPISEDMREFLKFNFDMEIVNESIEPSHIIHTFNNF